MKNVTAVLSMLHEPADSAFGATATGVNSACRLFRQDPVLCWTLDRLCRSKLLGTIAILCWSDQVESVRPIADEQHAHVLMKTPRIAHPLIDAVAAAQRWADGWRGGLLGTCEFDRGFFAPWILEIVQALDSDAVMLVDPASGLVDAQILDAMIQRADEQTEAEMIFTPTAPGLAGVLLRPAMLHRLAAANLHPGRALHYMPQQPARDPIAGDACVMVATPAMRTTRRFKLDSDRQIRRVTNASISLNGQLVRSGAEELVSRLTAYSAVDPLPRELVLELTTRRQTRAIFRPIPSERDDLNLDAAEPLLASLAEMDDARLTLGAAGDPLLSGVFFETIDAAQKAGIGAIHVETDLLAPRDVIDQLAASAVDVVSVHLPATSAATYAAVMGVDRFVEVIENLRQFVTRRAELRRSTPLIVPIFTKCRINLSEMESWYDQWLGAVGSAVIAGPGHFAGRIPDVGVADMAPSTRSPCARLASRLTVLCDGNAVMCENDIDGTAPLGHISQDPLAEIWQNRLAPIREDHAAGALGKRALCQSCGDWNRP